MSRFYALKMAQEVAQLPMIAEKQHLFGLIHNVVYSPTSSKMESYSNYYKEEDAQLFKNLIESNSSELATKLNPLEKVECNTDSKFRLDLCVSHDSKFVAMQLNHVSESGVTHITPIRYFEGAEAEAVTDIFD